MAFLDDEEDYDADTLQETRKSYEGEDTSPTSERELKGWYAYPIAAEVFAVVAVGTYFSYYTVPSSSPNLDNISLVSLGHIY
jgi:MFS-type transporter involved in bile tolerance (Atg22 family)